MKLFGLLNTKDGADAEESPGAAGRTALSATSVALVIKHFPIGTRLQYFAEYQKSSKNETIVVAYSINDHLIYSQKDIQAITRDGRRGFVATVQGTPVFFDRVSSFHILVPRIIRRVVGLAHPHHKGAGAPQTLQEQEVNDFVRGNSITMIMRNDQTRGIIQLDTMVKRSTVVLKEGLYPNKPLVVLEPLLDTFECIDIRAMARFDTEIPTEIFIAKEEKPQACLIQDFSEKFIRIQVEEPQQHALKATTIGQEVVLKVVPELQGQRLVIQGRVFRKRHNNMVISMDKLMKNGQFHTLDALDEIYIKSAMLDHPKTKT